MRAIILSVNLEAATLTPDDADELAERLHMLADTVRRNTFSVAPKLVLPVPEGQVRIAEEQR